MDDAVRLLFDELVQLSPAERAEIFNQRKIPAAVRIEVESLLGFDSASSHSLTDRVSGVAAQLMCDVDSSELTQCGPYRLVRQLGAGGMGAVYVGARSDGEVQQQVAVKLLRPGADRPSWNQRFLKER